MIILIAQITNIKAYPKRIRGIGNYKNNKRVIGWSCFFNYVIRQILEIIHTVLFSILQCITI